MVNTKLLEKIKNYISEDRRMLTELERSLLNEERELLQILSPYSSEEKLKFNWDDI